ncbi:hypothetical protein KI387_012544, partial [Taxus chinensis]
MKMTRNMNVIILLALLRFSVGTVGDNTTAAELSEVASSLEMFVDEVPDMPKLRGYVYHDKKLKPAELRIGMFETKWKFHRDLPWSTVYAFGLSRKTATVPGPTIEAIQGIQTFVRWENHLPRKHILPWDPSLTTANPKHGGIPTVVHLHGGIHEPESDGHPYAWFTANFRERGTGWKKSTYHYANEQQAGSMWYHDHALGVTRVNLLAGLLGAYVIRNPKVEKPLNLPSGRRYDRFLFIFDRSFTKNGSIYLNSTGNYPAVHPQWQPAYFGDAIIVNGKVWPYMKVKRRKYRFRIVNSSNARFYNLTLSNGLNLTHIGSDSAYLPRPVTLKQYVLSPSEIADIIIDFGQSSTHSAILTNSAPYPFPNGATVDSLNNKVMKFIVENKTVSLDTSRIPKKLVEYRRPMKKEAAETRYISMYEFNTAANGPIMLLLNNSTLDAAVTETPKEGSSEIWHIINLTDENHPLHIHLALFVVLKQTQLINYDNFTECMVEKNNALKCNISRYAIGNTTEVVGPDRGWKNVFKILPGYMTTLLVQFTLIDSYRPYPFNATAEPGYVYHCH